jgi:hypothetical protein
MLAARHALHQDARTRNPQRWSGHTRNWTPVGVVTLNPERNTVVQAQISQILLSGSIGEPAFPSRPGSAQATARNEGDERCGATRSAPCRARACEASEHRTFSAMSTVSHSSPVGGSHLRTSALQPQQLRREEESLRDLSGNSLDTHRVDTIGLLLTAVVYPANIHDRDGGLLVFASLFDRCRMLGKLFVDAGYHRPKFRKGLRRIRHRLKA